MRDYRSRQLQILILATLLAVMCLTSIGFFIDSVYGLLANTEAALLGGDRVISSSKPIEQNIEAIATNNNLATARTISFFSMLTSETNLALTSLKAVDQNYPLRGQLYIDGEPTNMLPETGEIWLEERAMLLLGVKIGDQVTIDRSNFTVTHVLTLEPDRVSGGFSFAPRGLINIKDLSNTALLQPGSRANYRLLVAGNSGNLTKFDQQISNELTKNQKMQVAGEDDARSNNRLLQTTSFLRLAVLVNVILVSVVIGIVAFNYISAHMREVAIIRCLGATSRQVVWLFALSLLLIGIFCGAIGSGAGYILSKILGYILLQFLNLQLPQPSWQPALGGIGLAVFLVVGLGLPPLQILRKVSPIYVLRSIAVPTDKLVWLCYWIVISIFILGMYYVAANEILFQYTIISLLSAMGVSLLFMQILFHYIPRWLPALSITLKLSLRNIISNSTLNSIQFLAFVIVITLATILFSIRSDLLSAWQAQMPTDAPNYFAINIQPDQGSQFKEKLAAAGIDVPELYPVIRGRLESINSSQAEYWRPFNFTWTSTLPLDNKILSGKWLQADKNEISVETRIAERLGIKLGDELVFNIMLREVTAKVTSIRSVTWESFNPNFYFIFSPQLMQDFSTDYMASFYVPNSEDILSMVGSFPSVTFISIKPILDQAVLILDLVSVLVAYIWTFTLLIGILLLMAVMLASVKARNYQNNLMRVLGASRRQIQHVLNYEFIMLGTTAGGIGSLIAVLGAKYLATQLFKVSYEINYIVVVAGAIVGMLLMLFGGILGTFKALRTTPIQLLRNLN